MRTTLKLSGGRALVVAPAAGQGVRVELTFAGVVVGGDVLTPDQCGALMFGIEQAAEAAGIAAEREQASEGTESAQRINAAPIPMRRESDRQGPRCGYFGCSYPQGECEAPSQCMPVPKGTCRARA